nr:retrovirus-related Pol polyprotein from transposon TNT 1-94 [Tanacetum cinerariifolium]
MVKEYFEGIQTALFKEVKETKEIFKQIEAEVEQHAVDRKCAEIERKNLLIENENLIAGCLSNEVLYSVMNVVNIVSRFSEKHDAYTVEQARNVELEAEISKLKHKIQKDDHSEMIKRFSNLETSQDAPEFDLFFEINKMKEQLQGKNNTIRNLKVQISQMNKRRSEADRILDFKALDSQNIELTEHVWKASGRVFANVGDQWKPTRKKFTLGELFPLTRYMIGDSVISKVYSVEGLGHNLFSVGQFCNSNLEVAFKKHSCYVRDVDGVELLKGSRGSNLYTISVKDMMKFFRIDNGIEFVNQVLTEFYESVGITYQKSILRTPQQNGVVKRRNCTLVEATRTMLIFSKALMFLWVEAVATACYIKNRSIIHTRHDKTPYELVHDKKHDLTFLYVFGALYYPTNDNEDLGKWKAKADIGIFIGYAPNKKGYKIYNKRTR